MSFCSPIRAETPPRGLEITGIESLDGITFQYGIHVIKSVCVRQRKSLKPLEQSGFDRWKYTCVIQENIKAKRMKVQTKIC